MTGMPYKNRFGILKSDLITNEPEFNEDYFTTYYKHGPDSLNQAIEELYRDRGLVGYFIPELKISKLRDDFSFLTLEENAQYYLRRAVNIDEWSDTPTPVYKKLEYDVRYNPDQYPPDNGYYYQIILDSLTEEDIQGGDGFFVTILYGLYTWFNEFDWNRNTFNRNVGLYIANDKQWRLHPGRARTSFVQYSDANTPALIFVHESIDMADYLENAVRLDNNIEQIKEHIQLVSGFEDVELFLRVTDDVCDMWYTERINNNSPSGETFRTYFGNKLTLEYKDATIYINDEPIIYLKNNLLYFYESTPRYKL